MAAEPSENGNQVFKIVVHSVWELATPISASTEECQAVAKPRPQAGQAQPGSVGDELRLVGGRLLKRMPFMAARKQALRILE